MIQPWRGRLASFGALSHLAAGRQILPRVKLASFGALRRCGHTESQQLAGETIPHPLYRRDGTKT